MKWDRTKENIFEDIGFSPEEAENLKIRSDLMNALENEIAKRNLTQAETAKLMKVSQPRVSDLMRGEIQKFTIDMLINMSVKLGLHVAISIKRKKAA